MPEQPQQNPNLPPPYYFEEETISLLDVLLFFARQLKIILIVPTIMCILSIIQLTFFSSPVYVSSAKIISSSGSNNVSEASGIAARFGISLPGDQTAVEWVYPEIVKSRTLARSMLKRKFDTEIFGPQKPLLQILTYGNQKPSMGIDTLIKSGVNGFIDMVSINKSGTFYSLEISSSEPNLSRDIASALIEELDAHQREYYTARISNARKFIEDRIIETEKEMNHTEEILKDFKIRNRRIENSPALQLEEQRLSREVSVITGVFTTLKQQLETTKIEEVKDSEYVIVLDPPEAPLIRSEPQKRKTVIITGIIGICIGILLGFVKDYIDNEKMKNHEKLDEIKSLVFKNILDLIPFIKSRK